MAKKTQPTNKQHVVPQLYLRPFSNENGKLIAYDKTDGRIFPVDVADAAQKRGFLSVPELDGDEGSGSFAEMYFQLYENPAALAIRRVLSGLRTGVTRLINDDIRIALSLFLAVQYQRTQAARQRMNEINVVLAKLSEKWPDIPQLQGLSPAPAGPELTTYHLTAGLSAERIGQIADVLHDHCWGLYINRTDLPLWTSDNPVVLHCHEESLRDQGVGIGTFGIEISIPLAPHCLLVLLEREWAENHIPRLAAKDGGIWGSLTPDTATFCRSIQVRDSYRFVYSCKENDFALAEKMCTTHPALRDIHRARTIATIGNEALFGPDD